MQKFDFLYWGAFISIASGLLILLGPFLPEAIYQTENFGKTLGLVSGGPTKITDFEHNRLVIDKIGFNAEVGEAEKSDIDKPLLNGPIRIKSSSTPDIGGNTVIAAHRAYYLSGPTTFYNLPKLSKGDEIQLVWNKKLFKYIVESTLETLPNDISIENDTKESRLTLYTCTPLIDFTKRFVVRAKLVQD